MKTLTAEHRQKISLALVGIKRSYLTRKRMSISKMGKKMPPISKETRENMGNAHKGEKAYQWKGDKVGYRSLHHWIEKQRGKPNYCEHCKRSDKLSRQYHWANVSGKYKRDVNDFIRLCVGCHGKYDKENKLRKYRK